METIFDSRTLPAAKRRQAWRDAICQIYLQVDCEAEQPNDYEGFVRELRFGAITLTDTLSSPQSVLRQSRHIARLEKDCYFMGLLQTGAIHVRQADASMTMHAGVGALYCASEMRDLAAEWTEVLKVKTLNSDAQVIELSGGNQQKVVIAKALVQKPRLVIFDEPTRGVDVGAIAEIHHLISALADEGLAVVLISSYLPEILSLSDRILVSRQGRIVEELSPGEATSEAVMFAAVH